MEPLSTNLISPETRVDIPYYIDTRKGPLFIMRDYCVYEQGRSPCTGSLKTPCNQKYESCTCRGICTDDVGSILWRLDEMPDWILPIKTKWLPETFELRGRINNESTKTDRISGNTLIDIPKKTELMVQYLLKEWDLEIKLLFEVISQMNTKGWDRLSKKAMGEVTTLPGDFLDKIIEGYIFHSKYYDSGVLSKAKLYFRGGNVDSGIDKINTYRKLWKEYGIPFSVVQSMPIKTIEAFLAIVDAEIIVTNEKIEIEREKARR